MYNAQDAPVSARGMVLTGMAISMCMKLCYSVPQNNLAHLNKEMAVLSKLRAEQQEIMSEHASANHLQKRHYSSYQMCRPGSYRLLDPIDRAAAHSACSLCIPGYFTAALDQIKCKACAAGKVCV